MKTIFITICAFVTTSIFAQKVKNYSLKTNATIFEINLVSPNIIIEGYDGNEILVKETKSIENEEPISISIRAKGIQKNGKRKKGLKSIKKTFTSDDNLTVLKEEKGKALLTNALSVNVDSYSLLFPLSNNKSKFVIKVPNRMKIVVGHNDNTSPFALGKDTLFEIKNFKGEIELSFLNQDVILNNISNSTLVNTLLGDIEATFDNLKKNAVISLVTTNGFVDVSVPAKEKITFDLESLSGEILTNLSLTKENNNKTGIPPYKYEVLYNGGGKKMMLKTTAGDIYIRKE